MIRRRLLGLLGAALVALAGASSPAAGEVVHGYASPLTGNNLLEICQTSGAVFQGECVSFIVGVISGVSVASNVPQLWCIGAKADGYQLKDIVVKDLIAQPETRDQTAVVLIVKATMQAFPCK